MGIIRDTIENQRGLPAKGFKNLLINGGFDVWQRGTNIAGGNTTYTADRWQSSSVSTNYIITKGTNLAQIKRPDNVTEEFAVAFYNQLETVDSLPLAGKKVTFSGRLTKSTGFSCASITVRIVSGTGIDEGALGWSGWTGQSTIANIIIPAADIDGRKFNITGTVPTNSSQVAVMISTSSFIGTALNDSVNLVEMQLEEGSVATPFEQRPYGLELSLCQRYFNRLVSVAGSGGSGDRVLTGVAKTTTDSRFHYLFPVTMRTLPTFIASSLGEVLQEDISWTAVSTLTSGAVTNYNINLIATYSANTATTGDVSYLATSVSTLDIAFDAEL